LLGASNNCHDKVGKKQPTHAATTAETRDYDSALRAYACSFTILEQPFLYPEANYFSYHHNKKYDDQSHFNDLTDDNTLIWGTYKAVFRHVHPNLLTQLKREVSWSKVHD